MYPGTEFRVATVDSSRDNCGCVGGMLQRLVVEIGVDGTLGDAKGCEEARISWMKRC